MLVIRAGGEVLGYGVKSLASEMLEIRARTSAWCCPVAANPRCGSAVLDFRPFATAFTETRVMWSTLYTESYVNAWYKRH